MKDFYFFVMALMSHGIDMATLIFLPGIIRILYVESSRMVAYIKEKIMGVS